MRLFRTSPFNALISFLISSSWGSSGGDWLNVPRYREAPSPGIVRAANWYVCVVIYPVKSPRTSRVRWAGLGVAEGWGRDGGKVALRVFKEVRKGFS